MGIYSPYTSTGSLSPPNTIEEQLTIETDVLGAKTQVFLRRLIEEESRHKQSLLFLKNLTEFQKYL